MESILRTGYRKAILLLTSCWMLLAFPHMGFGQPHHDYVSEAVWDEVTPYLMPNFHPIKPLLDKMFSKKRILQNKRTLWEAGFEKAIVQPFSQIIVTTHKDFPGYIFKLNTDNQGYRRDKPEYYFWLLRTTGAALIREKIAEKKWEAFFTVPHKWIYPLPAYPKAAKGSIQKNFILVEERMNILSPEKNRERWRSKNIKKQHLDMLFHIVTDLGLIDCSKPENIPFCVDGKIAFVDTNSHSLPPSGYEKLFRIIKEPLRSYWQKLIDSQK